MHGEIFHICLSQEDVHASSVNAFKGRLDKRRRCQTDFFIDCLIVYKSYQLHDLSDILAKTTLLWRIDFQVQLHLVSI